MVWKTIFLNVRSAPVNLAIVTWSHDTERKEAFVVLFLKIDKQKHPSRPLGKIAEITLQTSVTKRSFESKTSQQGVLVLL